MAKTTLRHLLPHTHTYQKSIHANNKRVNKNLKNDARKFQDTKFIFTNNTLYLLFFFS